MDPTLFLPLIFAVGMMALVFVLIIFTLKYRLLCRWSYQSHEISAEIRFGRAKLFVDGKLEDEFAADRLRICMLKAMVEGSEIKVRVTYSGLRAKAEATANGEPLILLYAGK